MGGYTSFGPCELHTGTLAPTSLKRLRNETLQGTREIKAESRSLKGESSRKKEKTPGFLFLFLELLADEWTNALRSL